MHLLGPRDRIGIPVRIDSVETIPNEFTGNPELRIEATLRLSPHAEEDTNVILWAREGNADKIVVSEEFIVRDVTLEGVCNGQCYKAKAFLSAIWFSHESDGSSCITLVRG